MIHVRSLAPLTAVALFSAAWATSTPVFAQDARPELSPISRVTAARVAKAKETGARGLRSVVEEVMFDIMYELPEQDSGKCYHVTEEVVRGETRLFSTDSHAAA